MRHPRTRKRVLLTLPQELLPELGLWRYRRDFGVDARIRDASLMDHVAVVSVGVSGEAGAVRQTIDSLRRHVRLRVVEDE